MVLEPFCYDPGLCWKVSVWVLLFKSLNLSEWYCTHMYSSEAQAWLKSKLLSCISVFFVFICEYRYQSVAVLGELRNTLEPQDWTRPVPSVMMTTLSFLHRFTRTRQHGGSGRTLSNDTSGIRAVKYNTCWQKPTQQLQLLRKTVSLSENLSFLSKPVTAGCEQESVWLANSSHGCCRRVSYLTERSPLQDSR